MSIEPQRDIQNIFKKKSKDVDILYKVIYENETVVYNLKGQRLVSFPTEKEADEYMDYIKPFHEYD